MSIQEVAGKASTRRITTVTVVMSITLALLAAFAAGQLSRLFGFPRVIGQLVAGILLGFPLVRTAVFTPESTQIIETFSSVGLVMLLFLTGFELDTTQFRQTSRPSVLIAVSAAIVPFIAGTVLGRLFSFSWVSSMILGGCLSVTAEGTKAALLIELKKIRSYLGNIMLTAGILDDAFEIFFLSAVVLLAGGAAADVALLPLKTVLFVLLVLAAMRVIPSLLRRIAPDGDGISLLAASIVTALLLAVVSEWLGFGAVIGAFLAGIAVQKVFVDGFPGKDHEDDLLRTLAFAFVVPFFFVNIGQYFDVSPLIHAPIFTFSVLAVAVLSKLLGTLLVAPLVSELSLRQLLLVGWGMNSRGVMELVIALIALKHGLISAELYSAIVCTAVLTTLFFPFVIRMMLKHDPGLMERRSV